MGNPVLRKPSPGGTGRIAALLEQLAEEFRKLELAQTEDLVDQAHSPLGRRRHCQLVKSGAIPGRKVGRRWLATRADIEAFILQDGQQDTDRTDPEDQADDEILSHLRPRKRVA